MEFVNTENYPITVHSFLVMPKFELFFGNNPETFVVDGDSRSFKRRVSLSFWVFGQVVLNMRSSKMLKLNALYSDNAMFMNDREGAFYLTTSDLQKTSSGDYIQVKLSAPKGSFLIIFFDCLY